MAIISACLRDSHPRQDIPSYFELPSIQPRSNVTRLSEKKDVSPELAARLAKIEGAHLVRAVVLHLIVYHIML